MKSFIKLTIIAIVLLQFNTSITYSQNVSINETVRYINEIFSSSKSTIYKYDLALSLDGQVSINRNSITENKIFDIKVNVNDLDKIYISKDMEMCSGSIYKDTGGKHIKICCKNKSDCIYDAQSSEKYTCKIELYLDISDYDYQRCANALKHLITEGKKTFTTNQPKVDDPFAPKVQAQVNKAQSEVKKQSTIQKQPVSLKSTEQCNVISNNRPDGVVVKYMNPELVGKGTNCELGLSIQTTGTDFFFATTVRYFGNPQKLIGNLKIQLSNSQSLELKLYRSELATMRNEQIGIGIFYLKEQDVQKLKKGTIRTVVFQESTDKYQIVTLNQNFDVAQRHIRCLQ